MSLNIKTDQNSDLWNFLHWGHQFHLRKYLLPLQFFLLLSFNKDFSLSLPFFLSLSLSLSLKNKSVFVPIFRRSMPPFSRGFDLYNIRQYKCQISFNSIKTNPILCEFIFPFFTVKKSLSSFSVSKRYAQKKRCFFLYHDPGWLGKVSSKKTQVTPFHQYLLYLTSRPRHPKKLRLWCNKTHAKA